MDGGSPVERVYFVVEMTVPYTSLAEVQSQAPPPDETATWALVARAVMNLDEFQTRE